MTQYVVPFLDLVSSYNDSRKEIDAGLSRVAASGRYLGAISRDSLVPSIVSAWAMVWTRCTWRCWL